MANTHSTLIFVRSTYLTLSPFLTIPHQTGLFSSIVASFLIETYKILLPADGSQTDISLLSQLVASALSNGTAVPPIRPQTIVQQSVSPSAIRINILMFLSLFFSVTSALVSTLIQQWAREYLQYSQPTGPSATPHKRGRMRTYLFVGLSRFQMRRFTYSVPILLHIAVFLFFFSVSDWLYTINVHVGATARYCFIALATVYTALSVLPLIVRHAPYQTPLTTPLRGCISLIHISYIVLLRLVRRSSRAHQTSKGFGLFHRIHLDRSRALKREIKRRASQLDRSAMHWLLRELDEDDMDTFLTGLPGYILSPLTDTKLVVEGLREDDVPWHIAVHLRICVTSSELSQGACISRASAYIKSLRLISQTTPSSASTTARQPGAGIENHSIQAIMKDLESLSLGTNSSTALRASCVRGLVIGEFLIPYARLDAEELLVKQFPDYLKPLYRAIRIWKMTEIAQWSHLTGTSAAIGHPLPSDREMWTDVLYDGPLVNVAVLADAILSRASDEEVDLDMAWKTFETLLKTLGLAQVWASVQARARFSEVLYNVDAWVNGYGTGRTHIIPLQDTLNTVISGLRLVEVLAYAPVLLPTQIEAIFGREQLRNSELLRAFAAHLPLHVAVSTPETSKGFMERLILEDKLWEQLHVGLSNCSHPQVPTDDKMRIVTAFFDILDVAFVVLEDSSNIDWQSPDFDLLIGYLMVFGRTMTMDPVMPIGKVASFRVVFASIQFCHALLAQFSTECCRGEPPVMQSLNGLSTLVWVLGLGSREDRQYLTANLKNTEATPDFIFKVGAILDVVLRDGPLSNFCKLVRLTLDVTQTKASDSTLDNIKKSLAMLRRMLDTPHLPLVNASEEVWARFDDLRDAVRSRTDGAAALESGVQNAENFKSLLEMIEDVECERPAPVKRAEGTERDDNQISPPACEAVDQDTQRPGDAPVPGSSRQPAGASHPETRSPMDASPSPIHFSPAPGAVPIAGNVNRFGPRIWVPHSSNPMGARQLPISSNPTTQPSPDTGISYSYPPHWHAPRDHPVRFIPPYLQGMGGPRRANSLDSANFPAYAFMQSMLAGPSIPPSHLPTHPYPPSSPSSGQRYAGHHLYQATPVPLGGTDWHVTPDSKYERTCTCLFLCLTTRR